MSVIAHNDVLICASLAWVLAQFSKLLIVLLRERQLNLWYMASRLSRVAMRTLAAEGFIFGRVPNAGPFVALR